MTDNTDEQTPEVTTIQRDIAIERRSEGEKTTYKASLSSETPVRDFPWMPPHVLRHAESAVDLSRVNDRGLPFLTNHGRHDVSNVIGRIKNVRIEKKRLVGELVFSRANPAAEQIRAMVDEGTLTDMSITAEVEKIKRVEDADGRPELIEVLRWRPLEASVVTVGADHQVGIGRAHKGFTPANSAEGEDEMTGRAEPVETKAGDDNGNDNGVNGKIERGRQQLDDDFATKLEERRRHAIEQLATANKIGDDVRDAWIERGSTLERVADDILKIHEKRGERGDSISALDLTERETREYSMSRAILAARYGDWKEAGFELECHNAIAERTNKVPEKGGFFVPLEVQRRQLPTDLGALAARHPNAMHLQRDLQAATGGAGGFTVGTRIVGFDELLRNISFAFRMGVTRLSGLRDNVTIPRQSASATAEWLTGETDTPTESQQTFVQLSMTPKTVSAYTEISRQLLLQSSLDVEGLVNADLAAVAALAVDSAVLSGSGGSGQPEGLDNTTGVGAVSGTSLGFAGILEFQTDVAAANVMPMAGGYVTTPAVASLMIQRVKYTSTASPLWDGNIWAGMMQGFPAMSTNQVAAATMYFGDWAKAVVAEWGVLEVDTNPFANFPAGIIGVRVMYSIDVGIRYPAAFSIASSIT